MTRLALLLASAFVLGCCFEHQRTAVKRVPPQTTTEPTADGYRDPGAFRAVWRGKS